MKYTVDVEYLNPVNKAGEEWLRITIRGLEAESIREADMKVRNQYTWTKVRIKGIWESNGEEIYSRRDMKVTLLGEEWSRILLLLKTAEGQCEQECDLWEDLAKKLTEDGELEYPNAAGNHEFWVGQIAAAERLKEAINHAV